MQVIAIVFLYKKVGRAGVDLRGGGVQIRGGSHAGVMNKTMSVEPHIGAFPSGQIQQLGNVRSGQ